MLDELQLFSNELQKLLKPHAPEDVVSVQRGLLLYRQNMVYRKIEEMNLIKATVQDVVPYQVVLNLQAPIDSFCSCKQEHICRHKLAVFFSSYAAFSSVSDWIQNWKDHNFIQIQSKGSLPLKKAKELLHEEQAIENNYHSWKKFIEDTFTKQISQSIQQTSYSMTVKWDSYVQRVKSKMPLETEWKLLYLFVMYFHTFRLTIKDLQNAHISGNARHFLQQELDETLENLYYIMEQLTRISRPFAFDSYFSGIRQDLNELLQEDSPYSSAAMNVYRSVWTHLLKEKSWRREELAYLQQNEKGQMNVNQTIANIHLLLLTNHDEQVESLLHTLEPKDYLHISYWIRHLEEQQLTPFVLFITENITHFFEYETNYYKRKEFVSFFLPYMKKYYFRIKKTDIFEKFCETCLPYSFIYYSNYLLQSGKHKKWVELYLYSEIELDYISSDDMKIIQQSNPTLLLPLFTSIVNEKIENKNRQSYRAAVRYLKKIRTIYKKEKKMEQWERYIDKVQHKYRRLRAFQEELKRGKLIHAE